MATKKKTASKRTVPHLGHNANISLLGTTLTIVVDLRKSEGLTKSQRAKSVASTKGWAKVEDDAGTSVSLNVTQRLPR